MAELAANTSGGAPLLALLQAAAAAAAGANSISVGGSLGGQGSLRGPSPTPGQATQGLSRLQSMPPMPPAVTSSESAGLREQVRDVTLQGRAGQVRLRMNVHTPYITLQGGLLPLLPAVGSLLHLGVREHFGGGSTAAKYVVTSVLLVAYM